MKIGSTYCGNVNSLLNMKCPQNPNHFMETSLHPMKVGMRQVRLQDTINLMNAAFKLMKLRHTLQYSLIMNSLHFDI